MPLQIDVEGKLQVEAADLVGESVAVLGIKGSGKTNTAAVLIEELLVAGLPLTIVDPEGEYWGLKECFEILVVGQGDHVDMEIDTDQVAGLAEFSVRQGVPVILNLEGYDRDEAAALLQRYLRTLWQVCFQVRRPYELVLEEAHEFVPQGVRTPVKEILARIALRGRKRGLGLISISQRSARVDKDLLTQAAVLFLHQVVHPVDMKVYQDLIPLPPREVEEQVRQLARGQAIALLHNQVQVARIRVRHTFHVGATPGLDRATQPELRRIDAGLLDELRRLMAANRENVEKRPAGAAASPGCSTRRGCADSKT